MEYESRRVKWYWLILFVIYSSGACYVLYSGNPLLYSHHELRGALLQSADETVSTIPTEPETLPKVGSQTFFLRFNSARTGLDPSPGVRGKGYEEYEKHEVSTGINGWTPQHILSDQSGFYITSNTPWIVAIATDGTIKWRYRFLQEPTEKGFSPPLLDEFSFFVIHPKGELVALDKQSGHIRWILPLHVNLVADPFIWRGFLILPTKGTKGIELVLINRTDGKKSDESPKLDLKAEFKISQAPGVEQIIVTADNKVLAINPETWAVNWSQTLTEPIKGPATLVENDIYVATLGAKLFKLDGSRKGKIIWETVLEKPAIHSPTVLPIMSRLSLIDAAGALSTVDMKTGKVFWRYGIEAKGALAETWSSRLSAKHIEENKMDWLHKGWTIWTGCGAKNVCIYTPLKGQIINRLVLSGEPIAQPLLVDKRLVFFTQTRPGVYLISHQIEDGEVKRLRKQAAEASEKGSTDKVD